MYITTQYIVTLDNIIFGNINKFILACISYIIFQYELVQIKIINDTATNT